MTAVREQIKRLADEQHRAWESEGKALADIAQVREFSGAETEKYERLERAYNSFDERIKALLMQAEQEERAIAGAAGIFGDERASAAIDHADGIRAALRRSSDAYDLIPTSKEVRAWAQRQAEVRALSVGTATAGGNTVGKTFLEQLIEPLRQFSGVYAAGAYTFVTEKGDDVTIPRLNGFGAAAQQAEGTTITGTDPAFNQVTFKAFKYGDYRGISRELVEDSLVDIEGLVIKLMSENIDIDLGADLATGAGTTLPLGIAAAATVGVTGATGVVGVPSWDNLIDLQESVLAPYHANAAWVMANSAVAAVRKLKIGDRYLWEPNGQTGAPSQLLGYPVHRDPFFAATGLGGKSIAFGDFTRYWVRLVGGVRIERSDQALFGSDQIAFRAVLRADGNLVDASAVKLFQGGAS